MTVKKRSLVILTKSIGVSPQSAGTSITFTASGIGAGVYEYEFWLRSPSGNWSIVQGYGSGLDTWTWTNPTEGAWQPGVRVRQAGSSVAMDADVIIDYDITTALAATGVTLTSDISSPQSAGTSITFTASGIGVGVYEYEFWLRSPSGNWSIVQGYGSGLDTWTWTNPTEGACFGAGLPGNRLAEHAGAHCRYGREVGCSFAD